MGKNGSAGILLKDEPFFGMWKDREEMADSTSWVRNIRNTDYRFIEELRLLPYPAPFA